MAYPERSSYESTFYFCLLSCLGISNPRTGTGVGIEATLASYLLASNRVQVPGGTTREGLMQKERPHVIYFTFQGRALPVVEREYLVGTLRLLADARNK